MVGRDAAKEEVRQWYIEGQEPEIFSEMYQERLDELFPKSILKVQYSLNYCQGDGLNIYGTVYLTEILENIKDAFSEKELKYLQWVFKEFDVGYTMDENRHYCYCICDRNEYTEDVWSDMEYNCIRGIKEKVLEKFDRTAIHMLY